MPWMHFGCLDGVGNGRLLFDCDCCCRVVMVVEWRFDSLIFRLQFMAWVGGKRGRSSIQERIDIEIDTRGK